MNPEEFRLQGYFGNKYITKYENNKQSNADMRSKTNKFQDFNYTIQGELKIDNTCLEGNDIVSFKKCNGNNKQKWKYDKEKNKIMLGGDEKKCLSVKDINTIITEECDDNDEQIWVKEEVNTDPDSLGDWHDVSGRRVVLVESDNPWYINKSKEEPPIYKKQEHNKLKTIKGKTLYNRANYKSLYKINPYSPNIGYGHSYASRLGSKCNIEGFGGKLKNCNYINIRNIQSLIICIILLLIINNS
jgi:hypothetical protein